MLMALALMLALLVRKNSLILLVAVGLTVLLHALLHRDMRIVLAFLLGAVLCYGSYEAVWKIYEIRSGYENDGGIPIIAWVTMGMMENYGAYGWYNNYPKEVFYGEAAGSREAVSAIAKRDLKKRLRALRTTGDTRFIFSRESCCPSGTSRCIRRCTSMRRVRNRRMGLPRIPWRPGCMERTTSKRCMCATDGSSSCMWECCAIFCWL